MLKRIRDEIHPEFFCQDCNYSVTLLLKWLRPRLFFRAVHSHLYAHPAECHQSAVLQRLNHPKTKIDPQKDRLFYKSQSFFAKKRLWWGFLSVIPYFTSRKTCFIIIINRLWINFPFILAASHSYLQENVDKIDKFPHHKQSTDKTYHHK